MSFGNKIGFKGELYKKSDWFTHELGGIVLELDKNTKENNEIRDILFTDSGGYML